jgi:hypothetical protein
MAGQDKGKNCAVGGNFDFDRASATRSFFPSFLSGPTKMSWTPAQSALLQSMNFKRNADGSPRTASQVDHIRTGILPALLPPVTTRRPVPVVPNDHRPHSWERKEQPSRDPRVRSPVIAQSAMSIPEALVYKSPPNQHVPPQQPAASGLTHESLLASLEAITKHARTSSGTGVGSPAPASALREPVPVEEATDMELATPELAHRSPLSTASSPERPLANEPSSVKRESNSDAEHEASAAASSSPIAAPVPDVPAARVEQIEEASSSPVIPAAPASSPQLDAALETQLVPFQAATEPSPAERTPLAGANTGNEVDYPVFSFAGPRRAKGKPAPPLSLLALYLPQKYASP